MNVTDKKSSFTSNSTNILTFARGLTKNSPFDIITAGKSDSNRHIMQNDLQFSNSNRVIPQDLYPKMPTVVAPP
jgi:hypothetical protein